ncbi:hypothetical protein QOT17_011061 [Balamuthia mandrillaris]
MHTLNALNIYLHHSKGSKQLVTFSFADYVVQYFEEHTTQYGMDYQLPLIKPLHSNVCLNNGAPLEFLIRANTTALLVPLFNSSKIVKDELLLLKTEIWSVKLVMLMEDKPCRSRKGQLVSNSGFIHKKRGVL